MNRLTTILTLLLATTFSVHGAQFEVEWVSPEDFRDAHYYDYNSKKSRSIVLNDLQRFFERRAKSTLPEGGMLKMSVTQLDLAGEFEPWLRHNLDDVRIVKSIYPAFIEFDYQYMDANGTVIAEGNERLRDNIIYPNVRVRFMRNSENYPYIKSLVIDWMRELDKEVSPDSE